MRYQRSLNPLLSGIGLLLLMIGCSAWLLLNSHSQPEFINRLLAKSHRVLAFKINANHPAVFKVHPQDKCVELISNLDLFAEPSPDTEFSYSLEVEFLDSQKKVIQSEIYWESSRRSQWIDEKLNAPISAAFYINEPSSPADSRITTIFLPENLNDEIWLKVNLKEPANGAASIRMYKHVDIIKGSDLSAVKPLSQRIRSKISRHNLYGYRARDMEIQRFLRDVWKQIPAEGRSGLDYFTRDLFLYDRETPLLGSPPPEYRTLDAGHPLAVAFSDQSTIQMTFASSGTIKIRTTTEISSPIESVVRVTANQPVKWQTPPGQALVKIESAGKPLTIKTFKVDPQDNLFSHKFESSPNFFPPRRKTNYYRTATNGDPVKIDLPPSLNGCQCVFKMVCRVPLPSPNSTGDYNLSVDFHDQAGKLMQTCSISGSAEGSGFAQYKQQVQSEESPAIPPEFPSLPQRFYLRAPDSATSAVFHSDSPMDLAFFAQLNSDKPRSETVFITEKTPGLFRFSDNTQTEQNWFYFRPTNAAELDTAVRKKTVSLPDGIYELNPDSSEDISDKIAQTLYPDQTTQKWTLFEKLNTPITPESNAYVQCHTGVPLELNLMSRKIVSESLSFRYFLSSPSNPMIKIFVDGQLQSSFRPFTTQGYFRIPALTPGRHSITVSSESSEDQFFIKINPGISTEAPIYTARSVFKLRPDESMHLNLKKQDWASAGVNIKVYSAPDATGQCELSVNTGKLPDIQAARPATHLSSPRRLYTLLPNEEPQLSVLCDGSELLSCKNVFFPLHDDLPPDYYTLNLELNSGHPVFIRFFQLIDGRS